LFALLLVLITFGGAGCNDNLQARRRLMKPLVDVYPDLDALKNAMRKGRDYRIRILDRASTITIVAPHGGYIDEGTSALAREIAGHNYNLFDFQGLLSSQAFRLHVTSTRFRDPELSRFLRTSAVAVSVHGMDDEISGQQEIWLGGLNKRLKGLIYAALLKHGFAVNFDPPRFKGEHEENVVNLALQKGVQLELPGTLRRMLYVDGKTFRRDGKSPATTEVFDRISRAVRVAIAQYARTR
jgi:phage replication-related protein YjqB (UPF0714/DUF867 family)